MLAAPDAVKDGSPGLVRPARSTSFLRVSDPSRSRFLGDLRKRAYAKRHSADLVKLATLFQTDKWGTHSYAPHYQHHFAPMRRRPLTVLEIGVGGHDNTSAGGESLRMWKAYFSRSQIVGIDLYDKTAVDEPRIRTFQAARPTARFSRV